MKMTSKSRSWLQDCPQTLLHGLQKVEYEKVCETETSFLQRFFLIQGDDLMAITLLDNTRTNGHIEKYSVDRGSKNLCLVTNSIWERKRWKYTHRISHHQSTCFDVFKTQHDLF